MEQAIRELARFLAIPFEEAAKRVKDYTVMMAAGDWDKANPKTKEDVETWYKESEHYLYELIPWNYGNQVYNDRVAPLMQYHSMKILEFGAGIGSLCIALAYAGNTVTYCDISPILSQFAKQRFEDRGLAIPIVSELKGQRDIDIIVVNDVFEHIHADALPGLLREMKDCLADQGFIYHRDNFGQQDIFPMHYNHSETINKLARDAGLEIRGNGDFVKGGATQGIQIGIPCIGEIPDEIFFSILSMKKPPGTKITKIGNKPADLARNLIVDKLEKDWLFFMDSDQTFHPDTLERLMSWELPIVSGLYFKSPGKPLPHVYEYAYKDGADFYQALINPIFGFLNRYKDELAKSPGAVILPAKREDLIQCEGIGAGCLLVHRRIFAALTKPYFQYNDGTLLGEDFYFCRKVLGAGFKIYVDPGVICGHRMKGQITHQHFMHLVTATQHPTEYPYPWGE